MLRARVRRRAVRRPAAQRRDRVLTPHTLLREWAYAAVYRTSDQRTLALQPWLDYYNHRRPHGALSHKPPASRLPTA